MDFGLVLDQRFDVDIVGVDEGIDVLSELFDRGEGCALQRLPLQDREPDFHLVKPGSARRREVEAHIWVPLEPTVVARLVGTEVIEHDVDGRVRPSGDDAVHEVEELDAPPALLVRRRHLAGGDLEGGKQRRSAVALVIVAVTAQRPAVWQLQIVLRALQRGGWIEGFSSTQMTIAFAARRKNVLNLLKGISMGLRSAENEAGQQSSRVRVIECLAYPRTFVTADDWPS